MIYKTLNKETVFIQFSGDNSRRLYFLITNRYFSISLLNCPNIKIGRIDIQWENLTKFDITLSRFDLVYERSNKPTDKIDTKEFLNSSYRQFQESHPNRKLVSERNRKGLIHYRIYRRNNYLRFEAEMKGKFIKTYHILLIQNTFEEFAL